MRSLILASSSPRRFDLLTRTGLPFEVARPDIDETPYPNEPSDDYVQRLSLAKAWAIAHSLPQGSDALILSADTTVADGDQILGKPQDAAEAVAMLRQLRNRYHVVHTSVILLDAANGQSATRLTTAKVFLRDFTDSEIEAYVASGDPMDKAGSYAIHNKVFRPVARLDGCFTSVMGLPMCAVATLLADCGVILPTPIACSPTNLPCQFSNL
ncbi:MAG: Maf family protein [Chloroflexota bacterium]